MWNSNLELLCIGGLRPEFYCFLASRAALGENSAAHMLALPSGLTVHDGDVQSGVSASAVLSPCLSSPFAWGNHL